MFGNGASDGTRSRTKFYIYNNYLEGNQLVWYGRAISVRVVVSSIGKSAVVLNVDPIGDSPLEPPV